MIINFKVMKKIIFSLLAVLFLGVAYWLISPIFIDKEVSESLEDIQIKDISEKSEENNQDVEPVTEITILKKGTLQGESGHRASGEVSLVQSGDRFFVRFEDNFDAENGPDLFVHLGNDGAYDKEVNLGVLKGNIGGQNYEIPADINVDDYSEVWIWCRAFSVPFASAKLKN